MRNGYLVFASIATNTYKIIKLNSELRESIKKRNKIKQITYKNSFKILIIHMYI